MEFQRFTHALHDYAGCWLDASFLCSEENRAQPLLLLGVHFRRIQTRSPSFMFFFNLQPTAGLRTGSVQHAHGHVGKETIVYLVISR